MDIAYKSNKMRKTFNSTEALKEHYGKLASRIESREDILRTSESLADVPAGTPTYRHELKGNRKGEFAVKLNANYRLVFVPNHDPVPRREDGGIDLEKITSVILLSVEDYHGRKHKKKKNDGVTPLSGAPGWGACFIHLD